MNVQVSLIHKNEEAEKKWCPFTYSQDIGQNNNNKKLVFGRQCLTTGCMAWIDETDLIHEIALGRCGLVSLSKA